MQVACKTCDKALSRHLGLGKSSLVATTQRRQLDITRAINFACEVGEVRKLSINLNFLERPLKIYRFSSTSFHYTTNFGNPPIAYHLV
jgi:hypothetical protein